MSEFLHVSTTTSTQADAESLANLLLEARLVACAQVSGPISSQYWWQGQLETTTEWQCSLKTTDHLYPAVEALLIDHHPYETPEVIAVPILRGNAEYFRWLSHQLVPDLDSNNHAI